MRRTPHDVALDLIDSDEKKHENRLNKERKLSSVVLASILLGFSVGAFQLFIQHASSPAVVIPAMLIIACGIIIDGRVKEHSIQKSRSEMEYYIPIVMERLVMAVEAGQDIIPAVKSIVDLEERSSQVGRAREVDTVTALLKRVVVLSEKGMAFDEALKLTSHGEHISTALKHAFVHLGIAFKEGGELIAPLRELSDATQLYYQESVEEEIAKLPVRATLPLVCTFAGLMTFFLASPLIQIITFASKAAPK